MVLFSWLTPPPAWHFLSAFGDDGRAESVSFPETPSFESVEAARLLTRLA